MKFGSVCSGVEAARGKCCAKCGEFKDVEHFHRQPSGKLGRHSYCKKCANKLQKDSRVRNYTKENKAKWQIKTRYGLTPQQVEQMKIDQGGVCAICRGELKRMCIDHCHETGKVRGLLCHRCNVLLAGWDQEEWRTSALRYLGLNE